MSILDQWQDRWNFAVFNNEQRFQTQLVTKRRFYNAVVSLPLNRIQNRMLRPDVETKGFDAAAFRFVEDVFIGAAGGQISRSLLFAYGKNKDFRDVLSASRVLEGFGMAAEAHDDSPRSLGEEISAGRSSAMYDLVNHSAGASDMLDQFVHGKLEMTPTNVARLERHLHALARVCEEKAEMMGEFQKLRDPAKIDGAREPRPTDYIRDVMEADEIVTPREAQIMAGFVSAVLVESAQPLGSEHFVPQDKQYLSTKQTIDFAKFISEQLELRGLVPNIALDGSQRPFPDLAEGAMIKALHAGDGKVTGYEKITKGESIAFANAIHSHIKKELGTNLEAMLTFVDQNFDKVERSIARSKEDPTPASVAAWPSQEQEAPETPDRNPEKWTDRGSKNPFELLGEVNRVVKTAGAHLFRPEANFENKKLFGRAIAGQLCSYPVRVIDEALKSFLRPGSGLDMMVDMAKTGKAEGELINREDLANNMKSNTFRMFTSPLAASFGTVLSQELVGLPKGLAVEAAGRAGKVLKGAIKAGHVHAPQVGERVKATSGEHPSLQAVMQNPLYRENLDRINKTPAAERSEEDYRVLANYYNDLSHVCVSVAEETLSPFGVNFTPDKIDSMGDVVSRVLRRKVEDVPDAMVALAFVQTFLEVSAKKSASMEFVDPHQLLIKHGEMSKLSNFIDSQASAAGLSIAKGNEGEGIEAGQLLEPGENGALGPAKPETLVRFANVVVNEMKHYVDLDLLISAARGQYKAEYMNPVEKKLFGHDTFKTADEKSQEPDGKDVLNAAKEKDGKAVGAAKKEEEILDAPDGLSERWQGRVGRKKQGLVGNMRQSLAKAEVKHEIEKLYGRAKGETVSSFFPSLLYNSLQHNESIINRSAIASAIYKTVTYPFMFSKGMVVGKEVINEVFTRKRAVVNEADVSKGLIEGAITLAGSLDPDLRQKIMGSNQINAALMQLEERPEFHDVPRIAAKPRDERTPDDEKLMGRFCDEIGETMIDASARIFGALGEGYQGESIQAVMERVLEKPVDNIKDAVIGLGFLHSMMNHTVKQLDVLRFIDPEDVFLQRKELAELNAYMNDQAAAAGFALHGVPVKGAGGNDFVLMGQDETLKEGELLQWSKDTQSYERASAESVIRFANLATAKFRHLEQETIAEKGAGKMASRYQRDTKNEIFTRL